MKAFRSYCVSFAALLFFTTSKAQRNSTSTSAALPPTCALLCLETLIFKSSCSISDIACVCTNQLLDDAITACVMSNCTIREQLSFDKYSHRACGQPMIDNTKQVSVPGLTGGGLAILAFCLRILAKLTGASGQIGLDDLSLCIAVMASIPFTFFSAILAKLGLGLDIWEVPFENITQILYIYYWDELIYLSVLPLTKISILFFYLRVFSNKTFRKVVYTVMALNVAYWISFLIVTIFQCRPIHGAWTRWDGSFRGECNNVNVQGWMSAAATIISDVATLVLPLPMVAKLALTRRKKVHIFLMFGVGSFLTIVSCIRLHTLVLFANTTNPTQDYVMLGYWSTIEVHVGIICACMPAIRQLLRDFFPAILGSTNLDSEPTTSAYASDSKSVSSPMPLFPHVLHSSLNSRPDIPNDHASEYALVDLESFANLVASEFPFEKKMKLIKEGQVRSQGNKWFRNM